MLWVILEEKLVSQSVAGAPLQILFATRSVQSKRRLLVKKLLRVAVPISIAAIAPFHLFLGVAGRAHVFLQTVCWW